MIKTETINESILAIERELDCLFTLAQACRMAGTYRVAEQIEHSIRETYYHINKISVQAANLADDFSIANR